MKLAVKRFSVHIATLVVATLTIALVASPVQATGPVPSTTLVSADSSGLEGTGASSQPALTPDGRYVAFVSSSTLAGPATSGMDNIYVKDRATGVTTRVSIGSDGVSAPN